MKLMPRLHYGFDDQERILNILKTNFQVLKLKFHACSMKQAFYPLHKLNIARTLQHEISLAQFFARVLIVKLACVNAA